MIMTVAIMEIKFSVMAIFMRRNEEMIKVANQKGR